MAAPERDDLVWLDFNPQAWLTDALERMVRGEVLSTELATLLPWASRRPATAAAAA